MWKGPLTTMNEGSNSNIRRHVEFGHGRRTKVIE